MIPSQAIFPVVEQGESRSTKLNMDAWGKLAEICGQYLSKGRMVYIEGRIRSDTWEQEGVKRYSYEIVADTMKMLGGGPRAEREAEPPFPPPEGGPPENDIPF